MLKRTKKTKTACEEAARLFKKELIEGSIDNEAGSFALAEGACVEDNEIKAVLKICFEPNEALISSRGRDMLITLSAKPSEQRRQLMKLRSAKDYLIQESSTIKQLIEPDYRPRWARIAAELTRQLRVDGEVSCKMHLEGPRLLCVLEDISGAELGALLANPDVQRFHLFMLESKLSMHIFIN